MANYVSVTSDKKKWTTFWLCVFFGYLGVHYFYVGRIGRGIITLLTMNFFLFGWFVDIIVILFGRFKDNVGQPLRE